MRKHRLGKLLLIVLCVSLLIFLAGCRPSPVLEQIIYEQNHQVDPDTETKTMNDDLENEEPDEDIPSRETVDDSEQEKDQEYTSALAGDTDTDSEDPDAVYSVAYSPNGELSEPAETNPTADSTSETATGTTEPGGEEAGITSSGEGGEEPGTEGESGENAQGGEGESGEVAQGGEGAGEGQNGGGNGDLDGEPDSGTGQTPTKDRVMTHINLETGEELDIPTNVETVAAPGEAATIVEMLDSDGRLVATSSSFCENQFAQSAFDLSGVSVCWNGDGSSNCDNFDALLAADPDVCFTISGQDTFSEGQIATLNERNIGYVVLPKLDSIAGIEEAVKVVGQVLDTRSTEGVSNNAYNVAKDYCSWADNMVSQARGKYSTKATAYIGRWDDDATWSIDSYQGDGHLASGQGVPVSMKYDGTSPLDECMGYAGLINTAVNNIYVEPLYRMRWEPRITGTSAKYPTNYTVHIIYSDELGIGLGTETFPAVIVEDSTIRDHILDGEYYYYHWQPGQIIQQEKTKPYGVPLPDGTFLATRIQNEQAYQILVNPSGVGDWAKGSVESPLEAVWLANKFQGLNVDVGSMVSDFYNTFYHTGADISAIMPADWTYVQ